MCIRTKINANKYLKLSGWRECETEACVEHRRYLEGRTFERIITVRLYFYPRDLTLPNSCLGIALCLYSPIQRQENVSLSACVSCAMNIRYQERNIHSMIRAMIHSFSLSHARQWKWKHEWKYDNEFPLRYNWLVLMAL